MRSFKFALIRNFVGMIVIVLAVVYLLFNVFTNNFVTTEAHRELSRSVADLENVAGQAMIPRAIFEVRELPTAIGLMEYILTQWRHTTSLRQLMMHTDGIIINEQNEIVPPDVSFINQETIGEITYLAHYFVNNRSLFENETMVRLANANHTYYLTAVDFPMPDGTVFSILLYTDISSAVRFMHNINMTLALLLLISAIVSAVLSIFLSSRVQRAVIRLGKYAQIIGQGTFDKQVGHFDYLEFSQLAVNMNSMSQKLKTYENNQKQFFQNVSHELRTPLMSIQGYAEGIAEDVIKKDDAARIILEESERMELLVNQLLYISRMDSGLDEVVITPVNIQDLLYDCAERMKMLAEKNNCTFVFNFCEKSSTFATDEEKLQRVISNLLVNAIRHAQSTITISYHCTPNALHISIIDDGDGINSDDAPFIFERFYKGVGGNSGLGLAICKDIIEKLGGTIVAYNNENGAVFEITLAKNPANPSS